MSQLVAIAKELLIIDEDLKSRTHEHQNCYVLHIFEQQVADTATDAEIVHTDYGDCITGGERVTQRVYVFVPKSDLENRTCFVYFDSEFMYTAQYTKEFLDAVVSKNITDWYPF